jgi:FAD binding domain
MTDLAQLSVSGRVATAADPDWDQARSAWNLAADQRPDAVVFVDGADDVAATIRFAADNDLRVAGQGTGHGAAPLAPLEGTILIKTERLRGIEVDPEARTARIEAGVLSIELAEAAGAHGLSSMPGSAPDVGTVGFTLGGGLSWLGRRYGFACNRVRAIDLIDASGESLTVDAERDPDLFWALRGGGGGYGIVVALHLDLLPIGEIYAGALLFPAEVGGDAIRIYRDWAAQVPDEVSSVVRFLTPPPIPDVPEPIRGKPLLTIDGACIGGRAEGEATFAPLRDSLGEPMMDTFDWMPSPGLCRIHMDPESPVPGIGEGGLVSELTDEAIEAFVAVAGPDSGSPLLLSELRQLGGALGRPAEGAGALSHLDAGFVGYSVGLPMTPELGEAIRARLQQLGEAMAPWGMDGGYYNFTEAPCDVDAILPPEVCSRLAAVKRRWDPDDRVVANHAISLGEA